MDVNGNTVIGKRCSGFKTDPENFVDISVDIKASYESVVKSGLLKDASIR